MPDPALLSPTGIAMRDSLPPVLRNSDDYLAVIHAYAREIDLLEATLETIRAQFNPATADVLLSEWERQVRIPVGGQPGVTDLASRRAAVISRLLKLLGQSEGTAWENAITALIGPVWSYLEHAENPPLNYAHNPTGSHDTAFGAPAWWAATASAFLAAGGALEVIPTGGPIFNTTYFHVMTDGSAANEGMEASLGVLPKGRYSLSFASFASAPIAVQALAGRHAGTAGVDYAQQTIAVASQWQESAVSFESDGSTASWVAFRSPIVSSRAWGIGNVMINRGAPIAFGDGDFDGWTWSGTPGSSTSEQDTPPAGTIQITIPYAPGSAGWVQATREIREVTAAHLAIDFESSSAFLLDVSPMDDQVFGN